MNQPPAAACGAKWPLAHLFGPLHSDVLAGHFEAGYLYLLLSPEVPWLDDGTRYFESAETRAWFFHRTRELLDLVGAPYEIIAGESWEERARLAAQRVSARISKGLFF